MSLAALCKTRKHVYAYLQSNLQPYYVEMKIPIKIMIFRKLNIPKICRVSLNEIKT